MKILHVIPAVAPRYGGPSEAVIGMCTALARRSADVLLVTTDADGSSRLPVELRCEVEFRGVRSIFFRSAFGEALKYSHPMSRWLQANVGAFDLIHIHAVFSHSSMAAARAARKQGVPYIIRPLGTLDPWSLKQKKIRKRVALTLGVQRLLRGASAVHYTTEGERSAVERTLNLHNGVVIPLGVDESLFLPATPDALPEAIRPIRGRYLLFLGRIHAKKNVDLLARTFLSLPAELRERWFLVIAGGGDPHSMRGLEVLLRAASASERVVLLPWIDGEGRNALLRNAACLILPSSQENFGLAVAESMAAGTPVIVSRNVSLAEMVERESCGWVFDLAANELGKVIQEALGDERELAERGARGALAADREFHWNQVSGRLMTTYGELIGR